MNQILSFLRGKPLVVFPVNNLFIIFWGRGLTLVLFYCFIAGYLGSVDFLGDHILNIVDRIAFFILALVVAPLGMTIECTDDFCQRDKKLVISTRKSTAH